MKLTYTKAEDGLLYPNLGLKESTQGYIGKYGLMRERYLKEALRWKKACSWKGKKRRITAKRYEFHKKCRKQTFYAADSRRCITVVMLAYPAVRGDLHDREPTFTDRCLRGCPRQRQRGRSGAMP